MGLEHGVGVLATSCSNVKTLESIEGIVKEGIV